MIGDRGFCDLWTLADKKFYGEIAISLFKFGTGGWQANNAWNYLKQGDEKKKCYKIVMCDINDEIVGVQCSLMAGIANELSRVQIS
jgi:hypothetical protein